MNKKFEEWLYKSRIMIRTGFTTESSVFVSLIDLFKELPFSMQWGVYLEFFDSVGICVNVWNAAPIIDNMWMYSVCGKEGTFAVYSETRQQAQQEAIKKAFEILEDRTK